MGNRKIAIASLAILFLLATGATTRGLVAQPGPVILTSPVETPGQFSYGFADPSAPSDGEWVAIDFHRDPHCAELAGFNLLMFVDVPNALSCPLTVDVKEWWDENDLAIAGGPWQRPPWSPNFRTRRSNAFPTMRDGHSQTVAHGTLSDGRSFQFHRNTHGADAITSFRVDFK